jgi:hypothetical protein
MSRHIAQSKPANAVDVDRIACERFRGLICRMKLFARLDPGEPSPVHINNELSETVKLAVSKFGRHSQDCHSDELRSQD